ncbi:MAG: hypothetical protein Q9166_003420 [cf. Caloplaca sp. 2 TL-2023]
MTRPLKKKNGMVAGMPRSSGVRNSPIGSNHADGEGLNSDDCSACGGPGELLCCDGCTRSYHFTCIDPPKDSLPDGEWYCQACASQPVPAPARGIFPLLRHNLQKKPPTAYNLPRSLRNYYEDVITGEDGEYDEVGAQTSKAKSRTGYDVPLDTLKLKDSKDNIILCYKCNKSAMGHRDMISCDFCNLYWHLDCVDPPLASAPKRFNKGKWKCPNHVDSEIAVPRSASGKIYKIRRPKAPRIISSALTRGIKNNGIIEIEDEISEDEDQPPGTIYRIPAKAIKLDFIAKVKQNNLAAAPMGKHESEAMKAEKRRQQHVTDGKAKRYTCSTASSPHQDDMFQSRTSAERETALSLAHFARSESNSQLSGDRVQELINTLYTESPIDLANNLDCTLGAVNGDNNNTVPSTNGNTVATGGASNATKVAASNKAAHAANQTNVVGAPFHSEPQALPDTESLAELLRLEAILQKKIANMRTVTASV